MKKIKYKDLRKRPVSLSDTLSDNKPKIVQTIKIKDDGEHESNLPPVQQRNNQGS